MKIKISALDALFSRYIRRRDGRCVCCADPASPHKREPRWTPKCATIRYRVLQNSHVFGRGHKSVRFNVDNCNATCWPCHNWLDNHQTEKEVWQAARLGPKRWADLQRHAATPRKPDQAMIRLWLR